MALLQALAHGDVEIIFPSDAPDLLIDFGKKCLTLDVQERPTSGDLLKHPMFKNGTHDWADLAENPRQFVPLCPLVDPLGSATGTAASDSWNLFGTFL